MDTKRHEMDGLQYGSLIGPMPEIDPDNLDGTPGYPKKGLEDEFSKENPKSPEKVKFSDGDPTTDMFGDSRVLWESGLSKQINWYPMDGVNVTSIAWLSMLRDAKNWTMVDNANVTTNLESRSVESRSTEFLNEVRNTGVELNLREFPKFDNRRFRATNMTLQINWESNGISGSTMSGLFTVVETEAESNEWKEKTNAALQQEPWRGGLEKSEKLVIADPSTTASTTTATSSLPTDTAVSTQPTVSGSRGGEAKDGNGGLPIGAIVGIAVGGAAVVILIITLIFCLYRRRHRKRQANDKAGYESQQGATVYFADKAANVSSDTPRHHSEEGSRALTDDMQMSSVTTMNQQQPHDHIQQDQQQHHLRTPSDGAWPLRSTEPQAPRSGTATPLGVSSNIAHLVEDGMTDDEIRRLEEEERQLDAAIAARKR